MRPRVWWERQIVERACAAPTSKGDAAPTREVGAAVCGGRRELSGQAAARTVRALSALKCEHVMLYRGLNSVAVRGRFYGSGRH